MTDYEGEIVRGTLEETGVLHLQLSRSPVNAANSRFFFEIGHYFHLAKEDPNVKVIVLSSAFPKYFTAGLDLKEAKLTKGGVDPAREALRLRTHILEGQSSMSQIQECDKPVIAAVSGLAYGLAIDIITACDVRYATSDSVFSIKEVDIGLAADMGTLQRVGKVIGNDSLAREVAFTGRPFSAAEAEKMGLVSRVFKGHAEVVDAALTLARVIASKPAYLLYQSTVTVFLKSHDTTAKSPVAVLGTKHLMNYSRDHTVEEGLAYTAIWNAAMIQTKDVPEAKSGFLEKKTPKFAKL